MGETESTKTATTLCDDFDDLKTTTAAAVNRAIVNRLNVLLSFYCPFYEVVV